MCEDKFNPYDSPCNGECIIDLETGFCQGCFRTDQEIARWLKHSAEERKEVNRKIEERKARAKD